MVVLRPTRKLMTWLPVSGTASAGGDTALGDWYVNRIVVDRQPLLLLVSSVSLLPMLLPARDVRTLPSRLGGLVEARLRRCTGVDVRACEAERQAMEPVVIAATQDRSVLGIMVDFAKAIPYYLAPAKANEDPLAFAESRLAETPCHAGKSAGRVIFPAAKARELLAAKWLAGRG